MDQQYTSQAYDAETNINDLRRMILKLTKNVTYLEDRVGVSLPEESDVDVKRESVETSPSPRLAKYQATVQDEEGIDVEDIKYGMPVKAEFTAGADVVDGMPIKKEEDIEPTKEEEAVEPIEEEESAEAIKKEIDDDVEYGTPVIAEPTAAPIVDDSMPIKEEEDLEVKSGKQTDPQINFAQADAFAATADTVVLDEPVPADFAETLPAAEDMGSKSIQQWKPSAIRSMPPIPKDMLTQIPSPDKMRTFTYDMITSTFGGNMWSSGFYFVPGSRPSMLPCRTYYVVDFKTDPYLPAKPGDHGAKLAPFFNSHLQDIYPDIAGDHSYMNVPVFISYSPYHAETCNQREYIYFGTYSQTRWSDQLDYDRMKEVVPASVRNFWAEQLSDPTRPQWVTDSLKKHLWPSPDIEEDLPGQARPAIGKSFHGNNNGNHNDTTGETRKHLPITMDGSSPELTRKDELFERVPDWINELMEWEEQRDVLVKQLGKENILAAFDGSDAGAPKGLRLWWEYLECQRWDKGFYDMMVGEAERLERGEPIRPTTPEKLAVTTTYVPPHLRYLNR
ncbi:hypothetical protein K402DRAFT_453600 [Aulographum hederae CBS 113979]|uniref:DUF6697 domain-containing protein n=1 Tax=Aulographum hederae CBS 113979 TaxID=1176131 RepID=A0A6G1H390_9PEZI|nr:hypothetical protein K402DRAFT_453600 [Aulographum hederae CBS 113979]